MGALHVFFVAGGEGTVREGASYDWTVPKRAEADDMALIYRAKTRELAWLARVEEDAWPDVTNRHGWGVNASWARITIVRGLRPGAPLVRIKDLAESHGWKAWRVLRGRRHVTVPEEHHRWFTTLVARHDKVAGRLLRASPDATMDITDAGTDQPVRGEWVIRRIIRDTRVGIALKRIYDGACQVCVRRILVSPERVYAEAHHLRPLGGRHRGPDRMSNVLVLCPTHHLEYDHALIAQNPETLRLSTVQTDHPFRGRKLRFKANHRVDTTHVRYHWRRHRRAIRSFANG